MATQTAIALTKVGSPLEIIEIPIPEPKDDEMLIKVTACASMISSSFSVFSKLLMKQTVAPFDEKLRDLGLFNISTRLPSILSYDLVGTVEKYSPTLSVTPPPSLSGKSY